MFIKHNYHLLVLTILIVSLILNLIKINQSFWLDEAAQALESTRPFREQFQLAGDFQPPLYHLWVYLFALVSHAESWLRLTSVIASLLTLYLTIKLSFKFLGDKGSLMAGLLLATSQFFVFYSQELRPYALSSLWGLLALYLLLQNPRSKWLILVNALGLLTVYTYILVILGQIVLVFSSKLIKLKPFLISLSLSLLLCLPWLPSFWQQYRVGQVLQTALPGWNQVVSPVLYKSLPLLFQKFVVGRIPIPDQIPGLALYGLITVAVVVLSLFSLKNTKLKPLNLYFWFIILFAFILNFFIPFLDAKRLLFLLPVFYILVTGGLLQFKSNVLIFFILLFLNSYFLYSYWTNPDLQREPWRQAINALERQANPSAPVIFAFSGPFAPWDWYQTADLPTISSGYLTNLTLDDLDPKFLPLLTQDEVYVIDYLMDLTDKNRLIYQWLKNTGFKEIEFQQYPGIGKIRHFQKAPPLASRLVQ